MRDDGRWRDATAAGGEAQRQPVAGSSGGRWRDATTAGGGVQRRPAEGCNGLVGRKGGLWRGATASPHPHAPRDRTRVWKCPSTASIVASHDTHLLAVLPSPLLRRRDDRQGATGEHRMARARAG